MSRVVHTPVQIIRTDIVCCESQMMPLRQEMEHGVPVYYYRCSKCESVEKNQNQYPNIEYKPTSGGIHLLSDHEKALVRQGRCGLYNLLRINQEYGFQ